MAVENRRIKVSELDFDAIKNNLKNFLKAQDEFTDYDFEGSGMNILLDVLAYNTHYNALYTNLAINEMFLDSAAKRSSLASISNVLGYVPKGRTSARAIVNVTVTGAIGNPPSLSLPALQPFAASSSETAGSATSSDLIFFNKASYVALRNATGNYVFNNVELIQGRPQTFKYLVQTNQRYIINNPNADLSTLTVRVQASATDATSVVFAQNESLVNNTRDSKIYYLKEIENGLYEVTFGDGVVSAAVIPGNIVALEYFVSDGEAANGARIFSYGGQGLNGGLVTTQTTSISGGGSEAESNDSIRFNAPRFFAAQNRTVTSEDYKVILPRLYPNIDTISVWGGEENDPPVFGKVFICVKPKTGAVLSTAAKQFVINEVLSSRNVVSIIPTIVDPTYLNLVLDVSFYYNPVKASVAEETLKGYVKQTITRYNETLVKFDTVFRMSQLQRLIDTTDESIVSSVVKLKITRDIIPNFGFESSYSINLYNPIYNEPGNTTGSNITSSGFTISGNANQFFLDDDTQGNIRLFYLSQEGTKVYTNNTAGTVDYQTGKIVVNSINIASAPNNIVTFTIEPSSYDVVSVRDQLITISEDRVLINAIPDKVASGEFVSGTNYIFTPNR
jgi:hypothetical protein